MLDKSAAVPLKMNGLNFWMEFFVRLAPLSRDQSLFLLAWFCQEACVRAPEAFACKCPITSSFQPHPRKKDRWVLFSNPPAAYQRICNYKCKSLEKTKWILKELVIFSKSRKLISERQLSSWWTSKTKFDSPWIFPCIDKYSHKLNQFFFLSKIFLFRNFCRLLVIIS